jgi:glycosyltransferase involved in cell wall biosynthesis
MFLRYLDAWRFNVDLYVAADGDRDFPIQEERLRRLVRRLIQRRGMQYYKLSDLVAEVRTLRKCVRSALDVVHYLDGEHSAQYLPRLLASVGRRRPRLVASYHQTPEFLPSLTDTSVVGRLDRVLLVSPSQVPFFEKLLPPDRIKVILHGIDTEFFRPARRPAEDGKFRCITVGHWMRDFDTVREVASRFADRPDVEFLIVTSRRTGPATTGLEDLPGVRLFRDHLDDAALRALYQDSHALFLPLRGSTANNAILEAIACGLPVVTTALTSSRAYLPGDEAILVEDNDPDEFAAAIDRLRGDPAARDAMGRAARRRAEELDWQRITPQFEAVYSELAAG